MAATGVGSGGRALSRPSCNREREAGRHQVDLFVHSTCTWRAASVFSHNTQRE
jgi:hypothetical protein